VRDFDWKLIHLVAHRCQSVVGRDGHPQKEASHVLSQNHFSAGQELLEELLDTLLSSAWAKKVDMNDSSSCRAFPFAHSEGGVTDRSLLTEMVSATKLEDFEPRAQLLAERYCRQPRAREGILLQLCCVITSGRARMIPFLFLFKCDFEEARKLTNETGLERVDEVILNKLKKVAIYPNFDGFEPDGDRVKLFQSTPSEYFHELLELQQPATAKQLFQEELKSAVSVRHPNHYDDYFVGLPPAPRELFGNECYIPVKELLPAPEVQYVNDRSCQAAREKYDRPVRTTIKIDGLIKVEAELAGLNRSFFLAKKGDQRYLIIRGERFVTGGQLSGLDFLKLDELEDLLPRVMEDVSLKMEDGSLKEESRD